MSERMPRTPEAPKANREGGPEVAILTHHAEQALEMLKGYSKEQDLPAETAEAARKIFEELTAEGIRNTQVYRSDTGQAAFPWTRINVGELARALAGAPPGVPALETKSKKEFIFGTFLNPANGNQFCFFEEVMHQVIERLPAALEAAKKGEAIAADDLYVLGAPSNEYGSLSKEFVDEMQGGNAFQKFGELYGEFVTKTLATEKKEGRADSVLFAGLSMGGSLAASTADNVLAGGAVTQETAERGKKPFLQVRMDVPPGPSKLPPGRKRWQLLAGFALDGLYNLATNPYARTATFGEKKFMDKADAELEKRGVHKDMSKEQTALKKQAIGRIIDDLRNGVPIPEDVKVTEVIGLYDPTMFQSAVLQESKQQREEHAGSLGEALIESDTPNRRTFGARMSHTIPFFRENELGRIARAAKALNDLAH